MALSYIEIGKIASNSDSDLKNTSDFQNAIAYQLFHAIELFYKYMLGRKSITIKTHSLSILYKEYTKIYPEEKFKLDHPFDFSNYECSNLNKNEKDIARNHLEKFSLNLMDQHLRYPADIKTGGYLYSIDASTFESIKIQMLSLGNFQN